ncbi:MAG: hypothetical protein WBD10_05355, partial [Acidobacteriaceae bacterium]
RAGDYGETENDSKNEHLLADRLSATRILAARFASQKESPPGNKFRTGCSSKLASGSRYLTSKSRVSGVCSDESPT